MTIVIYIKNNNHFVLPLTFSIYNINNISSNICLLIYICHNHVNITYILIDNGYATDITNVNATKVTIDLKYALYIIYTIAKSILTIVVSV